MIYHDQPISGGGPQLTKELDPITANQLAEVPNSVETLPKISIVSRMHERFRRQTDGRRHSLTRNSSADEIANVNFLRRHRTRTTKYKKEDNSKQLNSHNKVHVRYKLHEMTQARVDAGYIVFSDVCQLLMMMMTTTMMMMDGCLCEHSLEPERKNYCRRPRAETCRS